MVAAWVVAAAAGAQQTPPSPGVADLPAGSPGDIPDAVLADDRTDTRNDGVVVRWRTSLIGQTGDSRLGLPDTANQTERRYRAGQANLDVRVNAPLGRAIGFTLAGRTGMEVATSRDPRIQAYLRETNLAVSLADDLALRVGRVNYRSGVAYGFSPIDMLRARSYVDDVSIDPVSLRESRLGSFLALAQWFDADGSVIALVAPKLADPAPLAMRRNAIGLDAERTNADDRYLFRVNRKLGEALSTGVALFRENGGWAAGVDATLGIGSATIAYVEATAGARRSDLAGSRRFAVATGAIPAVALAGRSADDATAVRYDAVVGANVTPLPKFTIVAEYAYHGGGLTKAAFAGLLRDAARSPVAAAAYFHLRGYASSFQLPLARHTLFGRAAWSDVATRGLGLAALATLATADGSGAGQVSASYDIGPSWTLSVLAAANFGDQRSFFGSASGRRAVSIAAAAAF